MRPRVQPDTGPPGRTTGTTLREELAAEADAADAQLAAELADGGDAA